MSMNLPITEQITFIYVKDLNRSKDFYEGLLGFKLVLDQGSCRIVQSVGNSYLGYCEKGGGVSGPSDIILTFVTPDVDGWYGKLKEAGAKLESPPLLNEKFNIYHFFLIDPDGYKLEFQRFEDPNWNI
jgi:catechol 2,3-dioxygenase-like lactoylglutathione lyase family enzyme